jgi:hypothetical protein
MARLKQFGWTDPITPKTGYVGYFNVRDSDDPDWVYVTVRAHAQGLDGHTVKIPRADFIKAALEMASG